MEAKIVNPNHRRKIFEETKWILGFSPSLEWERWIKWNCILQHTKKLWLQRKIARKEGRCQNVVLRKGATKKKRGLEWSRRKRNTFTRDRLGSFTLLRCLVRKIDKLTHAHEPCENTKSILGFSSYLAWMASGKQNSIIPHTRTFLFKEEWHGNKGDALDK